MVVTYEDLVSLMPFEWIQVSHILDNTHIYDTMLSSASLLAFSSRSEIPLSPLGRDKENRIRFPADVGRLSAQS